MIVITGLILLWSSGVSAQTSEHTLKAVYMEKFSRFVTWPEDTSNHFIITMYGKSPLTQSIKQIYSIQKIKGREVVVKEANVMAEIEDTHILFIASNQVDDLPLLLSYIQGKPILTISHAEGFAKKGVIINFFVEQNRLRFEVNEEALLQSPLQMSFYLLNSARIIHSVTD
ncbi:MAG: YfiR family protein [Bacteroidota bacterium]